LRRIRKRIQPGSAKEVFIKKKQKKKKTYATRQMSLSNWGRTLGKKQTFEGPQFNQNKWGGRISQKSRPEVTMRREEWGNTFHIWGSLQEEKGRRGDKGKNES